MRIRTGRAEGSVLIVMIVVMAVVGVTLGSYLQLVSNQNISIMRSMAWNSAISVAEAGIEEAMAHINRNGTNRTADDWDVYQQGTSLLGTNLPVVGPAYVVRERIVGTSKYKVFVSRDIDPPIIYAEGHVQNPATLEYLPKPRVLRVTTASDSLFTKGMVAKGEIDLSGNGIKTDSFDSSDPLYNTDGKYDSAKAKDNGDVATNSSMIDSLDVWNADVYGRVSTGPGGQVKVGRNGAVGNKAHHDSGVGGIQDGYFTDDMNVQFPDVQAPFSGGAFGPTNNVTLNGTTYTYAIGDGNYQMNSLSLSGNNGSLLVNGDAVLYVTGDISLSGQSYIYIAPGATLQLYVGGNSSIGGKGVMNADAKASSFSYWGLPTNKQISMHGNAAFTGTIYAPQAALTLGGGGNNNYDFVGATITDSVKMNGHFKFHYDEALRKFGPNRGYIIASWNEAAYNEVYASPGL